MTDADAAQPSVSTTPRQRGGPRSEMYLLHCTGVPVLSCPLESWWYWESRVKMAAVPIRCILELQIRRWKVDRNFVGCDVDVLYYYSSKLLIYYFMICKINFLICC